jgi:hypothetical protein
MNFACYAGFAGLTLVACGGSLASSTDAGGQGNDGLVDGGGGIEGGIEASGGPDTGPGAIPDSALDVVAVLDAACMAAGEGQPTQPAPTPLPSGSSCAATSEPVAAWSLGGSGSSEYRTGFDTSASCNGEPSLHLASSTATGDDFGEMGNAKTPGSSWLGHRLRLSGWIQSSAVTGWAGLWMRVDSSTQTGIEFDNMQCRPVSGTTGWAEYQVVLDVPTDADLVAYGILLSDQGEVWLDGVSLDVVDDCVPATGCP